MIKNQKDLTEEMLLAFFAEMKVVCADACESSEQISSIK